MTRISTKVTTITSQTHMVDRNRWAKTELLKKTSHATRFKHDQAIQRKKPIMQTLRNECRIWLGWRCLKRCVLKSLVKFDLTFEVSDGEPWWHLGQRPFSTCQESTRDLGVNLVATFRENFGNRQLKSRNVHKLRFNCFLESFFETSFSRRAMLRAWG